MEFVGICRRGGFFLDGVYRRTEGQLTFQAARAPSRNELAGLLDKIIVRLMKTLTR
jgi:hypothetical protein